MGLRNFWLVLTTLVLTALGLPAVLANETESLLPTIGVDANGVAHTKSGPSVAPWAKDVLKHSRISFSFGAAATWNLRRCVS